MDFDELKRIAKSGGMHVSILKRDGVWEGGWMNAFRGSAFGAPEREYGCAGATMGGYTDREAIVEELRKIILIYARAANTDQGREAAALLEKP